MVLGSGPGVKKAPDPGFGSETLGRSMIFLYDYVFEFAFLSFFVGIEFFF
jgi:hypothetical protein